MSTVIIVISTLTTVILAANRLAGSGSRLGALWDAYSDRIEALDASKSHRSKPVTKRFLVVYVLFSITVITGLAFWEASDGESALKVAVYSLLLSLLFASTVTRLYKEYRKPGHGSRRQPNEFYQDEDW